MSSTRACLLACAALLSAGVCSAQTTEEVRRDAQMHLGAFYLTPRYPIKEFGVDSNVFNSAEPRRDFTFTFAPHVDAWLPFGRRALVAAGIGSEVVYYQKYASERSLNPDVDVRTDVFLGRITPFAQAGYLRTRQRPNFEIDVRSLRQEHTLQAGADVRIAGKLSVEVAGNYRKTAYDAEANFDDVNLRDALNRATTTGWAEARYAATPLTTFTLRTESSRDRFELSPLRDADSIKVMPGVEFKPRALISGSARVGFRRFNPTSPSLEGFAGIVAATSLSYTLRGSMKLTVTADRDLTYSYTRAQPYFVVDAYGLTVRRQIVGAFDVTGGVQHQRYSYRDLFIDGAPTTDLDRVDVTRAWLGSIGYRLGRSMRAGFGSIYRERHSNSSRFRDYGGFRFITTLDYEL